MYRLGIGIEYTCCVCRGSVVASARAARVPCVHSMHPCAAACCLRIVRLWLCFCSLALGHCHSPLLLAFVSLFFFSLLVASKLLYKKKKKLIEHYKSSSSSRRPRPRIATNAWHVARDPPTQTQAPQTKHNNNNKADDTRPQRATATR